MSTDNSIEVGNLPDRENNRYWKIKLRKDSILFTILKYRSLKFLRRIIGLVIFCLLLLPINIAASVISFFAERSLKKIGDNNYDNGVNSALQFYKKFDKIYPARVYSPLTKSLELSLIKDEELASPVLEIAVGDGFLSSLIFNDRKDCAVIGGDMIFETILSAKKYNHTDKLVVFDAEEIPFSDNCFNTVIMMNLIHHLPSRKKILKEVKRVLKPGGRFIFTDNLYSWISCTFDSCLLRFFHLNYFAKKLEDFKLNLLAQKLLISPKYWDEVAQEIRMDVVVNKQFVSKRAMIVGSFFEYFNLLQGQPTRESMRTLLKLNFIRKFLDKRLGNVIKYLIVNDEKLVKNSEGAYLFVVLRKKDRPTEFHMMINNDVKYVCPKCKGDLTLQGVDYECGKCACKYITKNGIPIFISYQKELSGFNNYLSSSEKKEVREYVT